MRIETQIPHPHFKIVVYSLDSKYLIQIEAGSLMQAYKIGKEQLNGLEGVKQLLSSEFLLKVHDRFNQMFMDFKTTQENVFNSTKS